MESTITELVTIPVWRCECRTYTKETDIYCAECGKLLPRAYSGIEALSGHTSPDTAYVVEDYPYGFRLRCQIRYWLEYKKGHGFRLVSQTTNPKKAGIVWNKPKASTYDTCSVLVRDRQGHIHQCAIGSWPSELKIQAFTAKFGHVFTPEHTAALREWSILGKAQKHITYEVVSAGTYSFNYDTGKLELDPTSEGAENANKPRQTDQEVQAIWSKAIDLALSEDA